MALDLEQIKKIILAPKKKELIAEAVRYEERLRFHTETNIRSSDVSFATQNFLNFAGSFLPKDKFNVFLQLFKFPLTTPSVVEEVYRELERVFYSRNSSFSYQFSDASAYEDWMRYRRVNLNEPNIWKTEGWQRMKVSVNSILIVDMPSSIASLNSSLSEPYFYWLNIADVIDFETSDGEVMDWIIFKQDNNRIAVFDDTYIRIYQSDDGYTKIESLISEEPHDLGYCPARFFWSTRMTEGCKEFKKNPITKELSNLDWYLFYSLSKRYLDLYASYPIYSAYESECDYENPTTGDHCDGGFLRDSEGNFKILYDGSVERCPCCSNKRLIGPGSVVDVPIPAEGVDMRNPIQITTIDTNSLEYNVNECTRLRNEIIVSVVGSGGTVSEKEAINETQVAANFESKTAVLNALKTNFEQAQKFVEDTVCRLRYGKSFIDSAINWGTEFYVFTVNELYDKYNKAKANGASEAELDAISNQILETEYRANPLQLERMLILKQLEPYRHYTIDEMLKLFEKQLINRESVCLKINFINFVDRFERENINILDFARNKPIYEKISIIKQKLDEYAKQEIGRITTVPAST